MTLNIFMHQQSPFDTASRDTVSKIRNFFNSHDPYLNFALLLCFIPLPFSGLLALIIVVLATVFQSKNMFSQKETGYIITIAVLAVINLILFSYLYYTFIYFIYHTITSLFSNLVTLIQPETPVNLNEENL